MNSAVEKKPARGFLGQVTVWHGAVLACALFFAWAVAQFHQPGTGFSSLISIGDILNESKVSALRGVPHYVYEDSAGYDGAYYVQIALYPTLNNPELKQAIDNLPYRARRILFCWVAWFLGLGQPAWVVQAHALLNVLCWFALGGLLLRWFPPIGAQNFFRWFGVMFSHGVCMSVRDSLVDLPSLLLVATALLLLEKGRRGAGATVLALAGLGKETNLLAFAGYAVSAPGASPRGGPGDRAWREPGNWWRVGASAVLVALPLAAWMAYIRWKFGPVGDAGLNNFTWPLAGLAEKWGMAIEAATGPSDSALGWTTLGVTLALTVQWFFFVLRWRPAEAWWRVGAAFALMVFFLSTPVWEGFPGAATRVLLPMTLAFNVLVPRGSRWLPLLLCGNLTVVAAYHEFSPPPREFFVVRGIPAMTLHVVPDSAWYGPEEDGGRRWRWTRGDASLRLENTGAEPVLAEVRGLLSAVDERDVRILVEDQPVWSNQVGQAATEFQLRLRLPPGITRVQFVSEAPTLRVGTDPREFSFNVTNLEIGVAAAGAGR